MGTVKGVEEEDKISSSAENVCKCLRAYLESHKGSSPSQSSVWHLAHAVQQSTESPEAWWSFLSNEEKRQQDDPALLKQSRNVVSLFQLFALATQSIPRHGNYGNASYLHIWLGFARHQWQRNQDEARDTFKVLKSHFLGENSAHLYATWAKLEAASGHKGRASSILRKGAACNAHPQSVLEEAGDKINASYTHEDGANRSSLGKGQEERPDTMEITATMEITSRNGELDNQPLTSRQSQSHTATQHSTTSEEATFTLVNAHSQSPTTGHTNVSSSSLGSESENTETQDLNRTKTTDALKVTFTGMADASHGVQQPLQHRKIAHRPLQSSLKGPRRLGLGGGAARVPSMQNRLLIKTTEGRQDSPQSSGEKRKAQAELADCLQDASDPCLGAIPPRKRISPRNKVREDAPCSLQSSMSTDLAGLSKLNVAGDQEETMTFPLNSLARRARDSIAPQLLERERMRAKQATDTTVTEIPGRAAVMGTPSFVTERRPLPQKPASEVSTTARPTSAALPHANLTTPSTMTQRLRQIPAPPSGARGGPSATPSAVPVPEAPATEGAHAATSLVKPKRGSDVPGKDEEPKQEIIQTRPHQVSRPLGSYNSSIAIGGKDSFISLGPPAHAASASKLSVDLLQERVALLRSSHSEQAERPTPQVQQEKEAVKSLSVEPQQPSMHVRPLRRGNNVSEPIHREHNGRDAGGVGSAAKPRISQNHAEDTAMPDAHTKDGTTGLGDKMAGLHLRGHENADSSHQHLRVHENADSSHQQRPQALNNKVPQKPPAGQEGPGGRLKSPPPLHKRGRTVVPLEQRQEPNQNASNKVPAQVMGPPAARPRGPLAALERPGGRQSGDSGNPERQLQRVVREDENTVLVRRTRYTKLECVGRGGSSKVFKVMAPNRKIYALKRIKLQGRDREAATGFIDEISLLQRLRGQTNIIQLIDAEVIQGEGLIYMVLEYGDIDLARLLAKHEKACREGGSQELDENFIRLYWQQMLQAVHTIHEARIVHSDLKPANFLMVEGTLKLIDFGIAKAISSDTTSIARESQVGTLNYMSPEAILGGANNIRGGPPMKVGRASDIWSLGCILYQMVHGHTPFSALAFIQKMHAITDPRHRIAFPPLKNAALQDTLKRCLDRNPRTRIQMQDLMDHTFLRPATSAVPGLVGVTRSQLKKLLAQLSSVSKGHGQQDIDLLSEELFKQLSQGESVDLQALISKPNPGNAAPAKRQPLMPISNIQTSGGQMPPGTKVEKEAGSERGHAAFKGPESQRGPSKPRFDDTAGSSLSTHEVH